MIVFIIVVALATTQNKDQIKENVNVGTENAHTEGPGSTHHLGQEEQVPKYMSSGFLNKI